MSEATELLPSHFRPGASVFVNRPLHEGDHGLHQHDFIEIALVIGGSGHHRTIGGLRRIGRGDAFVIHPGQWHGYQRCRGLRLVNCGIREAVFARELAWVREEPEIAELIARRVESEMVSFACDEAGVMTCLGLTERIKSLTSAHGPPGRADIIASALLLLSELARQRRRSPSASTPSSPPHPAVAAAMRLIDADLARDWSLTEIARRLRIDRTHLIRVFRQRTGLTPMLWLARRRGERAAVALLTSPAAIGAIGRGVGWSDPNYFARRFRALFGLSPRAYRQSLACQLVTAAPETLPEW